MPGSSRRSTAATGAYYRRRTAEWLRSLGFEVATLEHVGWRPGGGSGRFVPVKYDQLGADLLAVSAERVVFVQVKLNPDHVAAAVREFARYPCPPGAEQWVVVWTPRRQPEVIVVADYLKGEAHAPPSVDLAPARRRPRARRARVERGADA